MFANTQNERPSARRHADEELKNGIIISVVVIIVNYYCSPDGRERDTTDDGSAATKRTRRRVGACARTFVCFTRVVIFIRAKVQVVRARAKNTVARAAVTIGYVWCYTAYVLLRPDGISSLSKRISDRHYSTSFSHRSV